MVSRFLLANPRKFLRQIHWREKHFPISHVRNDLISIISMAELRVELKNIWLLIIDEVKEAFYLVNRNNFPQFWYVPIALLHQTDSRVIHHKLPIFALLAEPDISNFTIARDENKSIWSAKTENNSIDFDVMWLWPTIQESRQFAFLSHALSCHLNQFSIRFSVELCKEFVHLRFRKVFADGAWTTFWNRACGNNFMKL